jgi:dihydrofolate reductase
MRLTLIAAQSLDGFITRHDTPGSDFVSDADRAFFREASTAA